ncbi:hypothetical protein LVD17_00005 [Fulvivirga ulvae]|uniref:hypothetical protein n=1 Tax=Fulvivirga ulvae TaxID=2904245 RepID=UPI001F46C865|nr:hypothetical protein [Fulvivirga ulvae]UII32218.1 hypothetical protein LVD17_00005 [Fulvivirga ulvae]
MAPYRSWQRLLNTSLRGKPHYGIGMEPFAIYTSGSDSYIQKFDNGEDAGLITLTGRKIDGPPCDGFNLLSRQYVNGQIIASYNGSCPDRATNLQLSYLADGQVYGRITQQVVSKVEVNDGYQSRYTAFSYTTNTAKADVSGITAHDYQEFAEIKYVLSSSRVYKKWLKYGGMLCLFLDYNTVDITRKTKYLSTLLKQTLEKEKVIVEA